MQRLAVQALVWTVTAAVQQASAPVPVTVASGGPIFESVGTNVFKRPGDERAFERDRHRSGWTARMRARRCPAGRPVVVTGQACVFEANVTWELRKGGAVVTQGATPWPAPAARSRVRGRSTSAPSPPVSYEFRAIDVSAKDGSVTFQNIVPFTVG